MVKIQDLVFIIVLTALFWCKTPRYFVWAGLISLILAIPLFTKWIFFTAERLTWYAACFFVIAILFYLFKEISSKRP